MYLLMTAISIHLLVGVFWAGSTFMAARNAVAGETVVLPQLGGAVLVVASGAYLWSVSHAGRFDLSEQVLALGAAAALLAILAQATLGLAAMRALRRDPAEGGARSRMLFAQRIAAALLAVTIVCMGISHYV